MPAYGRRLEVVNVATDTYSATEIWLPGSHLVNHHEVMYYVLTAAVRRFAGCCAALQGDPRLPRCFPREGVLPAERHSPHHRSARADEAAHG